MLVIINAYPESQLNILHNVLLKVSVLLITIEFLKYHSI